MMLELVPEEYEPDGNEKSNLILSPPYPYSSAVTSPTAEKEGGGGTKT